MKRKTKNKNKQLFCVSDNVFIDYIIITIINILGYIYNDHILSSAVYFIQLCAMRDARLGDHVSFDIRLTRMIFTRNRLPFLFV